MGRGQRATGTDGRTRTDALDSGTGPDATSIQERRPYLLGLTGNIACGKSTVLATLSEYGVEPIDADRVYHDLIGPDAPLTRTLVERFGEEIVAADGSVDRRALGAIVFRDQRALADLDTLTHPAVREALLDRITASCAETVVIDAVKLIESGFADRCDAVWLVTCDPEIQIERLMRRNGLSRDESARRVAAQPPLAPKVSRADVVIENSGDLATTKAQVAAAWQQLSADRAAAEIT